MTTALYSLLVGVICGFLSVSCTDADDDDSTDDDQVDDDTVDDDSVEDDDIDYEVFALSTYSCSDSFPYYCWEVYRCIDSGCSLMEHRNDQIDFAEAIWAFGTGDIFVVGRAGMIWHYDGTAWEDQSWDTEISLFGVWGTSPSDVYAVGLLHKNANENQGNIILHFDGEQWRSVREGPTEALAAVWGTSSSDVYAVGDGIGFHYNGLQWAKMEIDTSWKLWSVWGSSPVDVYSVGWDTDERPIVVHYDGLEWSKMTMDLSDDIWSIPEIWGLGPNEVYNVVHSHAANEYSLVMRYDGQEWSEVWRLDGSSLYSIWGTSSSNIFVAGLAGLYHFDGQSWAPVPGTPWLYDIAGVVH